MPTNTKQKVKKEAKVLLFKRDFHGLTVCPYSIIGWLYQNKQPKLARKFAEKTNKMQIKLEKQWLKLQNKKK